MPEDWPSSDPPEEFIELVRDALLHVYDPSHLQNHPLLALVADDGLGAVSRGKRLRQILLDAVESLHPAHGVAARSRAWRAYQLLESRYVEGNDVAEVMEQLAIGKSQYHRDHHHALRSVAALFWEDWRLKARPAGLAPSDPDAESEGARERLEAAELLPGRGGERIDPAEVLRGIGRLLEPLCEEREVRLRLDLAPHLPTIAGDRVTLRQALLAILVPAINAADHGLVSLRADASPERVTIEVRVRHPEQATSLESGIEAARPFAEALGGALSFDAGSADLGDRAILLTFPVEDPLSVLVVDNNPDFACLVERFLVGYGWDVVGAPDVGQALVRARQIRPRVVLLDIVLPGRDGWELLLELKATPELRAIPVVVCSVLDNAEIATSLGAAAYLHKPITESQLIATLDRFRSGDPASPSPSGRGRG